MLSIESCHFNGAGEVFLRSHRLQIYQQKNYKSINKKTTNLPTKKLQIYQQKTTNLPTGKLQISQQKTTNLTTLQNKT